MQSRERKAHSPSKKLNSLLALVTLFLVFHGSMSPCQAFGGATLQGLGTLQPGDRYSFAHAVSADGTIVAGYCEREIIENQNEFFEWEAFRWSVTDGMVGLGDLPDGFGPGIGSYGYAMSTNGSVVVGRGWSEVSSTEPFRWNQETGMVGLGFLETGFPSGQAFGVSGDGSVVVGYCFVAPGMFEAFRWTEADGMVGLGDFPAGPFQSAAYDASADGSVMVGYGRVADPWPSAVYGTEAFRWTANEGMVGLGSPPGTASGSKATAISPDGTIIVGSASTYVSPSLSGSTEVFRWTADTGRVSLGDLSGGEDFGSASALSDDGKVIIGDSSTPDGIVAMIWDSTHGMRSLEEVLVNGFNVDLQGFSFGHQSTASDISADGRVIVGWGINGNGKFEGWRITFDDRPCRMFGDISPVGTPTGDCVVDLDDLLLLLNGFQDFAGSPGSDLFPCGSGNGVVDLDDLIAGLAAIAGNYVCPHPFP